MFKLLLQLVGWTLAHTPEPVLKAFTNVLAYGLLAIPRRRRLVYSNLDHAFPERSKEWKRTIARESSRRLFETALLSFASPFFDERRIRAMIRIAPSVEAAFRAQHEKPHPMLVSSPHMAYWECLTWVGLFLPTTLPEFGVIFRPLDNPTADAWVKSTRERFGLRLLSRKQGLQEAFKILKRNAIVGVLFDQNAGVQGALSTLLGRVCSTSELPGLFAEKSRARIVAFYARRLGFWRMEFEMAEVAHNNTAADATLALNRWLESALTSDDNLCASWLWSHDRWRHQDMPSKRFRLEAKRNLLAEDLAARGLTQLPRKTRLWIRLPNWLGDVVMALPLLRALRAGRPDAEITLIGKSSFFPFLSELGLADHLLALPPRGRGYFSHFWRLRERFPDVYLLLTNSLRGDLEAWLTGCRQRFGLIKHGRHRPLLTHEFDVPRDFDESRHHQLQLWENFLRHFGLEQPLDRSPLYLQPKTEHAKFTFGFIPGSENNPEKRWPVAHWRTLLQSLVADYPDAEFLLFGTANDRSITAAIAAGFGSSVLDLAGKTDLAAYVTQLTRCRLLVTNDTGGMHLANALGVPLIALFGPTNPVRTGPVFAAPFEVLQPRGCPPTGGAALDKLEPSAVHAAAERFLDHGGAA